MIKDLGILSQKLLLFGGPYSNLEALEALKKEAEKLSIAPENCICTGDIVGYCADAEESLQFMKHWGARSILGNVEEQLRDEKDDCGCNFNEGSTCDVLSNNWYPKAKSQVSKNSLDYISILPSHISFETLNGEKCLVVHGSSKNISEFIFEIDEKRMKEELLENGVDIIIAGHSGLPFCKKFPSASFDSAQETPLRDHYFGNVAQPPIKRWINPGVIGMPAHNGKLNTYFGIFDPVTLEYTQKKLEYDYLLAAEKMGKKGFPESYAKTISETGVWPSEDVLPEGMKGVTFTI